MTKIPTPQAQVSRTPQDSGIKSRPVQKVTGTRDFEKLLLDQLGSPGSANESRNALDQGLSELEAPNPARFSNLTEDPKGIANGIRLLVDRFETYAQCLADPDKSLKEASKLLQETETGLSQLDQVPDTDPELLSIFNHLSTLVAVEKAKLARGDYT